MKYLREYNTFKKDLLKEFEPINFSQDDINDIKDIFQDLVDEHDMEDMEKLGSDINDTGVVYLFRNPKPDIVIIEIYTPTKDNEIDVWPNEKAILQSINDFIERMKLMNYEITKKENHGEKYIELINSNIPMLDFIEINIKHNPIDWKSKS